MDDVTGAGRQLPPVPLEPLARDDPDRVGDFRLLGRLGAGGMGVAYLAAGPSQNWVVVKTVWKHLAADRSFRARLSRELDAMGRASGPHTASLLDSDVQADPPWFAMEFIPGMTLTRRVDDSGALPLAEVVALAVAMVDVLVSVHGAGIVHRDVKPSNVMMSPTGPKLIDFGIADMSEGTQLTKTGMVLGSTGWLAPEQVRGDQVTSATDIHAWALCVLYGATGAPPFGADNSTATIYKVLEAIPTVPDTVPNPLRELLVAALAKEPSYRPTLERLSTELNPARLNPDQLPVTPAPTTPVVDTTPTPAHDMLTTPVASTPVATPRPPNQPAPGPAGTRRPAGKRWWPLAVGIGTLCVVTAVIVVLAGQNSNTSIAPADTSAAAPTVVAETAGDYMIGDTGPGGGIVFYDAGSVQPWGRYLEAGSELGDEDWCDDSELDVAGTKETIGAGAANTKLIAAACRAGAANTVSDYDGGGKTDWFLPSKDELNALYEQRDAVGGFGSDLYWSSSQNYADDAWYQDFTSGSQYGYYKYASDGVRPVRAFATSAAASAATTAAAPTVVAETAGDYMIGDTGPGGGIVFYDAGSVQPWGRYLEAGSELGDEDWCDDSELDVAGTKTAIGAGAANTKLIAAACRAGAANTISDYDGGGKTDWFLPSKDELNAMFSQRVIVGGFEGNYYYWSSSQLNAEYAWYRSDRRYSIYNFKRNFSGVRPVRAF